MFRRRRIRASRRTSPGAKSAQLHQSGWRLCVARERVALFPPDAGVPRAVRHAYESRGQAADQKHHLPHSQGFDHCDERCERSDPRHPRGRRCQSQRRTNVASTLNQLPKLIGLRCDNFFLSIIVFIVNLPFFSSFFFLRFLINSNLFFSISILFLMMRNKVAVECFYFFIAIFFEQTDSEVLKLLNKL